MNTASISLPVNPSVALASWADLIFVMEKKHRRILEENFPEALVGRSIICLNIPDEYRYMEPALIDALKSGLSQHIELPKPE